jgi:hypothetical protein
MPVREPGFYWVASVVTFGRWVVAEWDGVDNVWRFCGMHGCYSDDVIREVGPLLIAPK